MNAKFISDQEILDFLAESNKVTFKWSKLLFGKKHFKFLCAFWSNPESIKSLIPDEKIEEWEKDLHVINQISKEDGMDINSPSFQILHGEWWAYTRGLFERYLLYFSPKMLFVDGDYNERDRVPDLGVLYYFSAILLTSSSVPTA